MMKLNITKKEASPFLERIIRKNLGAHPTAATQIQACEELQKLVTALAIQTMNETMKMIEDKINKKSEI